MKRKHDGLDLKNLFCFNQVILILFFPPLIWNNYNSHMQAESSAPLWEKKGERKKEKKFPNKTEEFQKVFQGFPCTDLSFLQIILWVSASLALSRNVC